MLIAAPAGPRGKQTKAMQDSDIACLLVSWYNSDEIKKNPSRPPRRQDQMKRRYTLWLL